MLVLTSAASAGLLAPEAGGSKNADAIRTLYWLIFGLGVIIFVGVEGVLIYSLVKYRARKGAVAAQIHGNTRLEIGWTVGRRGHPRRHRDLHVRDAARRSATRRTPTPQRRARAGITSGVAIADREKLPPNGKSLNDQRQRPAVRLALHVSGRRRQPAEQRLLLRGDGRAGRRHGDAEDPLAGRRALLVDPEARRQVRRDPEHTNYTWFKIPADKAGTSSAASAPSSAGATTRT